MAIKSLAYLKSKFETSDVPTEQDYIDLLDSYRHLELANGGGGIGRVIENIYLDQITHSLTDWYKVPLLGGGFNEVPPSTAWNYRIMVVGEVGGGLLAWAYELTGLIKRDQSGNIEIVGGGQRRTMGESKVDFSARAFTDSTNFGLEVEVKDGLADGDIVQWYAHLFALTVTIYPPGT